MHLEIISPEKTVYTGNVESVTVPGLIAPFTILNHHAPIISVLTKGVITYCVEGVTTEVMANGGFVEVINNNISVCIE